MIKENEGTRLDILVTDVVLPEMGGKELAEKLRTILPHTKVLFTSGYTEDSIVQGGLLDSGIFFMQKPCTLTTLSKKVREALESINVAAN
ncbi:MAG: response regulator [Verrucomicrobiota bacterium]